MSIAARLMLLGSSVSFIFIVALVLCISGLLNLKSTAEHTLTVETDALLSIKEMYAVALQTGQATRNVILDPKDAKAVEKLPKCPGRLWQKRGQAG